jgi:leader peptidase (prepilin peptidase)/N-methyltransferase
MVTAPVILALWSALLGGCVGSFLNVVIYRLPRGMSLIYPPSQCPRCGHAIRWYHNIPVLGWLIIRGRCHDCGGRISMRYPAIEAIVAGMFLAVAWCGPLSAMTARVAGSTDVVLSMPLAAWALCGYHLVFLCGLLVVAVMEIDAQTDREVSVPWRSIGGLVLVGLLVPLGWLSLGPAVAGGIPSAWAGAGSLPAAVGNRLAGLGAAVLLALALRPVATESVTTAAGRRFAAAGFLLSGGFLGVLPVCVLGAATALGHLLATALARVMAMRWSPPWTPILWALALAGLLVWGPSVEHPPELGVLGQAIVVLVLVSVTGVLSLGSLTRGDRRGTD